MIGSTGITGHSIMMFERDKFSRSSRLSSHGLRLPWPRTMLLDFRIPGAGDLDHAHALFFNTSKPTGGQGGGGFFGKLFKPSGDNY